MDRLAMIDGKNWEAQTEAPLAVLVLAKSDCPACAAYSAELQGFLESDTEWTDVRFAKMLLDQRGLISFKRANPWLAEVDVLPYTVIYRDGEIQKRYAGGGIDRLLNRLKRLRPQD